MRHNSSHRFGTVLHSEGVTEKQLYSAYINALGERFIGVEGTAFITDMDRAHLTITDVAEIWRLLLWYCNAKCGKRYGRNT